MKYYCWSWCGANEWWLSLQPEAQAAWVSAWGTVVAAAVAVWVYVGSNRRQEAVRRADSVSEKLEHDLRERVVLQYVLTELRSIAIRMEDVMKCCAQDGRRRVIAKAAFINLAFVTEKHSLELLRPSLVLVQNELALMIALFESQVAFFNTELRGIEATWAAVFANHEANMRGRTSDLLSVFRPDPFGIDETDARTIATIANSLATQARTVALPVIAKLKLEDQSWKSVFDRCASHPVFTPTAEHQIEPISG